VRPRTAIRSRSSRSRSEPAIYIAKLQPLAAFSERKERFITEIKSVSLARDFDEVFYPGEIEDRNHERHREQGLVLPDDTLADLRRIARETGLEE